MYKPDISIVAEDLNISIADIEKVNGVNNLIIHTTNIKKVDETDDLGTGIIMKAEDLVTGIADVKEVNGVDKLGKGRADAEKADKIDNPSTSIATEVEDPDTCIANVEEVDKVNKSSIGITDTEEINKADDLGTSIVVEDSCKLLAVKQVAVKAFIFSFHKVICLFFSSLELETSSSLTTISMSSSVDTFVKQDIFLSK